MKGYVGYVREIAEEGPLIGSFFLSSCLTTLLFWHSGVGIWTVHQVSVVLRLGVERRREDKFRVDAAPPWKQVRVVEFGEWNLHQPSEWIVPSSESPWCQSPWLCTLPKHRSSFLRPPVRAWRRRRSSSHPPHLSAPGLKRGRSQRQKMAPCFQGSICTYKWSHKYPVVRCPPCAAGISAQNFETPSWSWSWLGCWLWKCVFWKTSGCSLESLKKKKQGKVIYGRILGSELLKKLLMTHGTNWKSWAFSKWTDYVAVKMNQWNNIQSVQNNYLIFSSTSCNVQPSLTAWCERWSTAIPKHSLLKELSSSSDLTSSIGTTSLIKSCFACWKQENVCFAQVKHGGGGDFK